MKLVNVSPVGDLDVPLLRRVIPAGAEFDATEAQATILLEQPHNYLPADVEATALRDKLAQTVTESPVDDTPAIVAPAVDDADNEGDDK